MAEGDDYNYGGLDSSQDGDDEQDDHDNDVDIDSPVNNREKVPNLSIEEEEVFGSTPSPHNNGVINDEQVPEESIEQHHSPSPHETQVFQKTQYTYYAQQAQPQHTQIEPKNDSPRDDFEDDFETTSEISIVDEVQFLTRLLHQFSQAPPSSVMGSTVSEPPKRTTQKVAPARPAAVRKKPPNPYLKKAAKKDNKNTKRAFLQKINYLTSNRTWRSALLSFW